jgi:hypothetical protein
MAILKFNPLFFYLIDDFIIYRFKLEKYQTFWN